MGHGARFLELCQLNYFFYWWCIEFGSEESFTVVHLTSWCYFNYTSFDEVNIACLFIWRLRVTNSILNRCAEWGRAATKKNAKQNRAQKPGLCCEWFHLPFASGISHLAALIRILRFCVRLCPVFMAGTRAHATDHCVSQCLCIRDTCKTPTRNSTD